MSLHFTINSLAEQVSLPQGTFSPHAQQCYERGVDLVDGYRGHPAPLLEAVRSFQSCGVGALLKVGIAYTLLAASYVQVKTYDPAGLQVAQRWLELAEADGVSENTQVVRLFLLMYSNEPHDFPALLMELDETNPDHFHVQYAKLDYLCRTKSLDNAEEQYRNVLDLARTDNQRLMAHRRMSGHYLVATAALSKLGDIVRARASDTSATVAPYAAKAQKVFGEMEPLSQDDPWYWHNRSLLQIALHQYQQAARYNKKALGLMTFPAALQIREELKKRLSIFYYFA